MLKLLTLRTLHLGDPVGLGSLLRRQLALLVLLLLRGSLRLTPCWYWSPSGGWGSCGCRRCCAARVDQDDRATGPQFRPDRPRLSSCLRCRPNHRLLNGLPLCLYGPRVGRACVLLLPLTPQHLATLHELPLPLLLLTALLLSDLLLKFGLLQGTRRCAIVIATPAPAPQQVLPSLQFCIAGRLDLPLFRELAQQPLKPAEPQENRDDNQLPILCIHAER